MDFHRRFAAPENVRAQKPPQAVTPANRGASKKEHPGAGFGRNPGAFGFGANHGREL